MNPASDSFPLTTAYFYLTEHCNLKCRHCWIDPGEYPGPSGRTKPIDLEFLKDFVREARDLGLADVRLTGGEPFLREDLDQFLGFLHDEKIRASIETNGTLLTTDSVQALRDYCVEQVSVSLDSPFEEDHDRFRGVPGSFRKVIRILPRLVESGISTQVIMSLHRGNAHAVTPLVELAAGMGVQSIKINPVLPTGRGLAMHREGANLSVRELMDMDRRVEEEFISGKSLSVHLDIPVALKSLDTILNRTLPQCRVLNIVGVLANGDLSLCGIGQSCPGIVLGNIARDSIRDLWPRHPFFRELRRGIPRELQGICGRCIFKFLCLGACRACAYFGTGDLFAPYPLCREAELLGLFPESRRI